MSLRSYHAPLGALPTVQSVIKFQVTSKGYVAVIQVDSMVVYNHDNIGGIQNS